MYTRRLLLHLHGSAVVVSRLVNGRVVTDAAHTRRRADTSCATLSSSPPQWPHAAAITTRAAMTARCTAFTIVTPPPPCARTAMCDADSFVDEAELLDVLHTYRSYRHDQTTTKSTMTRQRRDAASAATRALPVRSPPHVPAPPLLCYGLHALQTRTAATTTTTTAVTLYEKTVQQLLRAWLLRLYTQHTQLTPHEQSRQRSCVTCCAAVTRDVLPCHAHALLRMLERLVRTPPAALHATVVQLPSARVRNSSSASRRGAAAPTSTTATAAAVAADNHNGKATTTTTSGTATTTAAVCVDVLCEAVCAALAQRAVELTAAHALHMATLACQYSSRSSDNSDNDNDNSMCGRLRCADDAWRVRVARHVVVVCYRVRTRLSWRDCVSCLQLLLRLPLSAPHGDAADDDDAALSSALLSYLLARTLVSPPLQQQQHDDRSDVAFAQAACVDVVCRVTLLAWHALEHSVRHTAVQWLRRQHDTACRHARQRRRRCDGDADTPPRLSLHTLRGLAQLHQWSSSTSAAAVAKTTTTAAAAARGDAAAHALQRTRAFAVARHDKATLRRLVTRADGDDDDANDSNNGDDDDVTVAVAATAARRVPGAARVRVAWRLMRDAQTLHARALHVQASSCALQDVRALCDVLHHQPPLRVALACSVVTALLRVTPSVLSSQEAEYATMTTTCANACTRGCGDVAHRVLTLFLRLLPWCVSCDAVAVVVADELLTCMARLHALSSSSSSSLADELSQCLLHAYCRHVPRHALVHVAAHVCARCRACVYAPHNVTYRLLLALTARVHDESSNSDDDAVCCTSVDARRVRQQQWQRLQRALAAHVTTSPPPPLLQLLPRDAATAHALQRTLAQRLQHTTPQQQQQRHGDEQQTVEVHMRWLRCVCRLVASVHVEVRVLRVLARLQQCTLRVSPQRQRLVARSECAYTARDVADDDDAV